MTPIMYGKRIKEARNWQLMTQEQLAEKLHIDRKHLSRIERGLSLGTIELLVEISKTLSISIDYLLLGKTPSNQEAKAEVDKAIEILLRASKKL